MRWDEVIAAARTAVLADDPLVAIYGSAVRLAGAIDHAVPSLQLTLIADAEQEQWAPCTIQFDQFVTTADLLIASERRLRLLFNLPTPADYGGMQCWAQYVDGSELAIPDRDDYFGRALRFRFTPLRSFYTT